MKTSFKRLLSLVLVALTLVGCIAPVLAADSEVETSTSCKDCGEALGEPEVVQVKNCVQPGYKLYYCGKCQKYVTSNWEEATPNVHKYGWVDDAVVEGATCEDERFKRMICADCGKEDPETAPVKISGGDHTFDINKDEVPCKTTVENLTCTVCKTTGLSWTAPDHDWVDDADPGCTGTTSQTCSRCDEKTDGHVVEHDFVASVEKYPYNCQPGVMKYACSKCDKFYTITINGGDHVYEAAADTNASCTAPGFKGQWTCTVVKADGTVCGAIDPEHPGEVDPQKPHNWGELVPYVDSICGTEGNKGYKACTTCTQYVLVVTDEKGVELETAVTAKKGAEVIAAKTHDWKENVDARIEPDCSTWTNGTSTWVCQNANCPVGVETRTIDVGHTEGISGVIKPTCDKIGFTYRVCTECETMLETIIIPALNHTWYATETFIPTITGTNETSYDAVKGEASTEERGAVAPTCYADGTKAGVYCVQCGVCVTGTSADTNRPEHKFSTDVVGEFYKPATCLENGFMRCTVEGCNIETSVLPLIAKGEHTWSQETPTGDTPLTCMNGGEVTVTCTECAKIGVTTVKDGYPLTKLGDGTSHPESEKVWTVPFDGKATCEKEGYEEGLCRLCGADLGKRAIPALGHTPVYSTESGKAYFAGVTTPDEWANFFPSEGTLAEGTILNKTVDGYIFVIDPTCTGVGYFKFECKNHADSESTHFVTVTVKALGHLNTTTTGATQVSCTVDGNTGNTVCNDCGVTVSTGTITPAYHSYLNKNDTTYFTYVAAQAADCVNDGNIKYAQCNTCKGAYFAWDEATSSYKTTAITKAETVIEAGGHNYATKVDGYAIHCAKLNCELCDLEEGTICLGNGLTDAYKCTGCDDMSAAEGTSDTDTGYEQEVITNTWENHHENVAPIEAVAPKCWKDGTKATWECTECGYVEPAEVDNARPDHTMAPQFVNGDCLTDGYIRYYCTTCEAAAKVEATFVLSARAEYEYIDEFAKAEGHKNTAGTVLPTEEVECYDDMFGGDFATWENNELLGCTGCDYEVTVNHQQDQGVEIPADCITLAHTIYACRGCNKKEVVVTPESVAAGYADRSKIENHVAWEGTTVEEAGFFNGAVLQGSCKACGYEGGTVTDDSKIIDAYRIRLEVVGAGENFTAAHSSKIQVKVIIENIANEAIEVSKLSFSFVTSDILDLVIGDIYTGNLANQYNMLAGVDKTDKEDGDGFQTVNVIFTSNINETIAAGEELAIATLEFTVAGDIEKTEAFVINQPETFVVGKGLNNYKGAIDADAADVEGETALLGDIDGDGAIDEDDVYALTVVAFAEEQSEKDKAKYDIDKDGNVTGLDLYYIQNFIVGNITYEQLCATKPVVEAE